MNPASSEKKHARFEPGPWLSKMIPALMVLIAFGLLATLLVTVLSILGVTPGM